MKKKFRMIVAVMTMALAIMSVSPAAPVVAKAAKKIKLNKKKVNLVKGKTVKLKVKGTKKKVTWKSSKKKVATVNKRGKVTAKKKGTATITAKVAGKKLKCKVTVKNPKKKKIKDTPKPSKKPTPTPNPSEIATNTKKLKEYIIKNGTKNENGNPEIVKEIEGMVSRIVYQPASDDFQFLLEGTSDDNDSGVLQTNICMVAAAGKDTAKVTVEIASEDEEDDIYLLCNADVNKTSYNKDKSLAWEIVELSSDTLLDEELDVMRAEVSELADIGLLAGFAAWEVHLSEDIGLSMRKIGFTSFSLDY